MVEILLIAIAAAKLKHLKLRYLFLSWPFYPILITQCLLIFVQLNIFNGNYFFVQYASLIKISIILSFVFPIIAFDLYKPALIGSGSIAIGTLLNRFVIAQNNGKMPVFPSLSYLTGYVKPYSFNAVKDIHVLGSAASKYKILTDYIDVGYSVLSIGDLFIHFFALIMLYYTIKSVNLYYNSKSFIKGR